MAVRIIAASSGSAGEIAPGCLCAFKEALVATEPGCLSAEL